MKPVIKAPNLEELYTYEQGIYSGVSFTVEASLELSKLVSFNVDRYETTFRPQVEGSQYYNLELSFFIVYDNDVIHKKDYCTEIDIQKVEQESFYVTERTIAVILLVDSQPILFKKVLIVGFNSFQVPYLLDFREHEQTT